MPARGFRRSERAPRQDAAPGPLEADAHNRLPKARTEIVALDKQRGTRFAVRRFELGNRTSTTPPHLGFRLGGVVVIVHLHFRTVPVVGETTSFRTKLDCLISTDSPLSQIDLPIKKGD